MKCKRDGQTICILEYARSKGATIKEVLDGYTNPICNFCMFNTSEYLNQYLIDVRNIDTKLYLQSDEPIELKHQFGRQTKKKKSAGGVPVGDIKND